MKKNLDQSSKRKLVLDRQTLQPLQGDQLDEIVGGAADDIRTCLFNSCKTRIGACAA